MAHRAPVAKRRPRVARRARVAETRRLRLLVADSQAIDRGGLVGLLEDERDFDVVGEAATVAETIQQCRALKPDVLILSLNLPGQETRPAIPAIRAELPSTRIVALSERGAENCLVLNPPSRRLGVPAPKLACVIGVDCLQLAVTEGAMATLRRSADPEDLFRAVRAVAQGQSWYDPTTTNGLMSSEPRDAASHSLSPRELEVAAMIAEGQSNKEISTSLRISEPTVKKHVGRILAKLGLADRLQAGLFLARNPVVFKRHSVRS
jgi:DNA-binding NarL/FixJ family response regulator